MKKTLAILLAVVMVFTLAACSGGAGAGTESSAGAESSAPAEGSAESSAPAEGGAESSAASGSATEAPAGGADVADGDISIVMSEYAMLSPFFVAAAYGYMEQAQNMGLKATVMDAGNVLQRQIDMIDDAISQGADAVIIIPMDSDALGAAVLKCNEAGIPVFSIDRTITEGDVVTTLQSDNVECGRMVAREFLNRFQAQGLTDVKLIQIKGQLGSSPSRDRDAGFWEVINAQSDITVEKVAESAADWEIGPAEEQTLAHLTANPDANAIFYEADCMQPGVYAAMEQLGKILPQSDPGHIVNGGVDGSAYALEQIRAGNMDVCVSQNPYAQGIVATYLAYHVVKYGGADALPANLYFQADALTPENIGEYGNLWGDLPIGGSELPQELRDVLMS